MGKYFANGTYYFAKYSEKFVGFWINDEIYEGTFYHTVKSIN
jgi:hypothetical protein